MLVSLIAATRGGGAVRRAHTRCRNRSMRQQIRVRRYRYVCWGPPDVMIYMRVLPCHQVRMVACRVRRRV